MRDSHRVTTITSKTYIPKHSHKNPSATGAGVLKVYWRAELKNALRRVPDQLPRQLAWRRRKAGMSSISSSAWLIVARRSNCSAGRCCGARRFCHNLYPFDNKKIWSPCWWPLTSSCWWRQLHKTANHGKAFTAVQECCDQHCFARGATARPVLDAFDDSRGHLVRRRVFVCPEAAGLEALDAWSGCIPYWR